MRNKSSVVAFVAALAMTRVASAAYFYEEHFDTDTSNVTNTYPQYVLSTAGTADVSNQQLRLFSPNPSNFGVPVGALVTTQLFGAAISDIHVELKLDGATPGNWAIGLFLGTHTPASPPTGNDNAVEFFPGYTPVPGAVRVEGTGGFGLTSEGFVPALGLMHAFDIHTDGAGLFTVKVTEGTAANNFVPDSNTFSANWTNTGLISGYNIGFYLLGGTSGATATFDNLIVVPEPSAGLMTFLAVFLLARGGSRCK